MNNKVEIKYDEQNVKTIISINSRIFDTSRIDGMSISDWIYPFMIRRVKWDGIFEELAKVIGSMEFEIEFSGSNSAMIELMDECPDTVSLYKKKPIKKTVVSVRRASDDHSINTMPKTQSNNSYSSYSCEELVDMLEKWTDFSDTFSQSDKEEIFALLIKYAEMNNPDAQYRLGIFYTNKEWVASPNEAEANKWIYRAIQNYSDKKYNSDLKIQYLIATAYQHGKGVNKDEKLALSKFRSIAEFESSIYSELSCYYIADYYRFECNDEHEGEKWEKRGEYILRKLANSSNDPEIIEKYANHIGGVEGFRWHEMRCWMLL